MNLNSKTTTVAKEKIIKETEKLIPLSQVMGQFNPASHRDYVELSLEHADEKNMYLHRETYAAFKEMYAAANMDGLELIIRSACRNFDRQKAIWEAKWTGKRLVQGNENLASSTPNKKERALKILRWSSMPGSSRHHWGTDIDLNAFENDYFETGKGKILYDWLVANANKYGFCQVYTQKDEKRPNGYNEEKWHWSYIPLANKFMDTVKKELKNNDINGFLGSETATEIDVKNNFILGIAPNCN